MEQIRQILTDFTGECLKLTPQQFQQSKEQIGRNTLQLLEGCSSKNDFVHFLNQVEKAVNLMGGGTL